MPALPLNPRADEHFNREVLRTPSVWVGLFAAGPHAPVWNRETTIGQGPLFVFPHQPVTIRQEGSESFVADPTGVVLYNSNTLYRRTHVAMRPDVVTWVWVNPEVLRPVAASWWPEAADAAEFRFPCARAACPIECYRAQLGVVRRAGQEAESLELAERTLNTVGAVLAAQARAMGREPRVGARGRAGVSDARQHEIVEGIKAYVNAHYARNLSLEDVAAEVGVSVFHACRVFRKRTGHTIHAYLTDLRVRRSMIAVCGPRTSLTRVALEHGFSSHAHYSDVFRRLVGLTPSAWRQGGDLDRKFAVRSRV